jgi:DNA-binding NarL/FixJ family response regulator
VTGLLAPVPKDPVGWLTKREVEVLRLIASGATNRALAERLHISPATIRNHTHHIFEKLDVPNRLAAVTIAFAHGMLDVAVVPLPRRSKNRYTPIDTSRRGPQ